MIDLSMIIQSIHMISHIYTMIKWLYIGTYNRIIKSIYIVNPIISLSSKPNQCCIRCYFFKWFSSFPIIIYKIRILNRFFFRFLINGVMSSFASYC